MSTTETSLPFHIVSPEAPNGAGIVPRPLVPRSARVHGPLGLFGAARTLVTTHDPATQRRVETLMRVLRHPDPSQLLFQVSEIAGDETYLRHGVSVDEGDVVLDVGANVGVAAAYFALVRRAGGVHCFEPVAPVFAILRENLRDLPACVLHPVG